MRTELTNRGEYSTIDDMVSIWYNSDSYDTARSEAEWHGLYHTMCGAYGIIAIAMIRPEAKRSGMGFTIPCAEHMV